MTSARVTGPVIGALYVAGGLAVLAIVLLGGSGDDGVSPVLTAIGPLALLAGGAVVRWGHHLPRSVFHLMVLLGTALISAVVYAAPDRTSAVALAGMYLFIAVAAFFLFALPVASAYLGTAIGACTVVLTLCGVAAGPVVALAIVMAAMGLVVATLARRASAASLDGLTGLANRRGFDDALEETVRFAVRTGTDLSVALVDIDHFKSTNDQHGHAAGDELLRTVADEWLPRVPRGSVLARHGGDEFALLLPAHAGPAALAVVEQLRVACAGVPLSIGVAQHEPGEPTSRFMRRADSALYRAKAAGRARSLLHEDG
ncbi:MULTISPECIES: GGDEF domain-containing protein [unclassified Modestobacter]|uniref:GGDEF domain-containing protein n=1 Tax=unclassified Modestobacter TaxID=2643866 RepID=UPI0022AAED31|nr:MULTISPECIES: GGDEF domain-containing protein [unclassified Modestobacter]MCZ2824154.1 GGDEF domain-containing protein [Modestobacter sp. VKM Ac-2981]MCZ2854318.1 GGDEF domain-containing protein [Modestobacter sp. VKM Ac-2982]